MHIKGIIVLILLQTTYVASQNNQLDTQLAEQKEIIDYYKKAIKESENRYIEKGAICKKEANENKVVFDWNNIKASKEEIALAFRYFVGRNMDMCSHEEEKELVCNINKLMIFKRHEKLDFQNEIHTLFILLSSQDIFIDEGMKYLSLPLKTRKYFEEVFGTKTYGLNAIEEFFKKWRKLADSPSSIQKVQ